MEKMLSEVDKVILDGDVGGQQGVVPYLPLNQLKTGGSN
jgi:membrane protease subunit HflK